MFNFRMFAHAFIKLKVHVHFYIAQICILYCGFSHIFKIWWMFAHPFIIIIVDICPSDHCTVNIRTSLNFFSLYTFNHQVYPFTRFQPKSAILSSLNHTYIINSDCEVVYYLPQCNQRSSQITCTIYTVGHQEDCKFFP